MRLVTVITGMDELTQLVELAETLAQRYPGDTDMADMLIQLQALEGDVLKGGDAWSVPELDEK